MCALASEQVACLVQQYATWLGFGTSIGVYCGLVLPFAELDNHAILALAAVYFATAASGFTCFFVTSCVDPAHPFMRNPPPEVIANPNPHSLGKCRFCQIDMQPLTKHCNT